MISVNDFKTGMTIQYDGQIFKVLEFLHVKPGKGAAFVRTKLRNLRSGANIDKTFNAGEKVQKAHIDYRKMQYSYNAGDDYIFMDQETYEMVEIPRAAIEWERNFLKESLEVSIEFFENEIIGVTLPDKITLKIVECDPAVKGNTATNATKNATVETGFTVKVPLFIQNEEEIIVSTQDGK
ncbi:MAG: elongation factor P, partial [Culicoidibacterales bacterium]